MKSGYSVSIPFGMVLKKHYCHKCGERLEKNPKKRLVSRDDPDYRHYSRIGRVRMMPAGDVEVTEYNFKCRGCGNVIEYDEQVVIGKIQKKLGCYPLSESQTGENRGWAESAVAKNEKILNAVSKIIGILVVAAVLLYSVLHGNGSFSFYI